MSNVQIKPDRALVLRVAEEESAATGAKLANVLGMATDGYSKLARRRAMVRIVRETGCTLGGLAVVWGCDRQVVARIVLMGEPTPAKEMIYDPDTRERLRWAHGEDREAQIAAGNDAQTNADIGAWRRVCLGARA